MARPPVNAVQRDGDGFTVSAALLAEAFGLDETQVKAAMRSGAMTSRCEAGMDKDAGTWRLVFQFRDRALRLVVDASGQILKRSTYPVKPPRRGAPG